MRWGQVSVTQQKCLGANLVAPPTHPPSLPPLLPQASPAPGLIHPVCHGILDTAHLRVATMLDVALREEAAAQRKANGSHMEVSRSARGKQTQYSARPHGLYRKKFELDEKSVDSWCCSDAPP